MKMRSIGDRSVGAIGLGCMGMSWAYVGAVNEADQVLERALELGVNHWDTADLYGSGENEKLIGPHVQRHRNDVFLASKFGNVYDKSMTTHQDLVEAGSPWIVDGTSQYARKCIEATLTRLGVETIDLYYLHRVDSRVPIEVTVGTMAEFVKEGKVRFLGLSEVGIETIRRANVVHPIAAVQNEFSLWTRDFEGDVLPYCEQNDIAFVPYSPLGRGFLTGEIKSVDDLAPDDGRRHHPRFQGENFAQNLKIVDLVNEIAAAHHATAAQVAIAWTLQVSDITLPIPGTKRLKYLEDNAAAADLRLTSGEMQILSDISNIAGARYPDGAMAFTKR